MRAAVGSSTRPGCSIQRGLKEKELGILLLFWGLLLFGVWGFFLSYIEAKLSQQNPGQSSSQHTEPH